MDRPLRDFLDLTISQRELAMVLVRDGEERDWARQELLAAGFDEASEISALLHTIGKQSKAFLPVNGPVPKRVYDLLVQYPTGQVQDFDPDEMRSEIVMPVYAESAIVLLVQQSALSSLRATQPQLLDSIGMSWQSSIQEGEQRGSSMFAPNQARTLAEAWLIAQNTGDADDFLAGCADDIEIISPWIDERDDGSWIAGVVRGKTAVAEFLRSWSEKYGSSRYRVLTPIRLFLGTSTFVVHYKTVDVFHAADVINVRSDGRVIRIAIHLTDDYWSDSGSDVE